MKSRFRIFYGPVPIARERVPALFVPACACHNVCIKFNNGNWDDECEVDPELHVHVYNNLPSDVYDDVDKREMTMELLGI